MNAHIHELHAVTKPTPFGGSLTSAIASPEFQSIRRLVAAAGLDPESVFTGNGGGPISVAHLDSLLTKVHLGINERLTLKSTLRRLGLLAE